MTMNNMCYSTFIVHCLVCKTYNLFSKIHFFSFIYFTCDFSKKEDVCTTSSSCSLHKFPYFYELLFFTLTMADLCKYLNERFHYCSQVVYVWPSKKRRSWFFFFEAKYWREKKQQLKRIRRATSLNGWIFRKKLFKWLLLDMCKTDPVKLTSQTNKKTVSKILVHFA